MSRFDQDREVRKMTKDRAITTLSFLRSEYNCFDEGRERYHALSMAIEALSAQRWIPCSERLPEEGKMVLTTTIGTDIVVQHDNESLEDAIKRSMKTPVRVSIGFIGSDGWYGADWFPSIISPSAWMPLPEPYKEEN